MHAVVNQESLGDLLRNVMCQLLIDNSAKRWLGELAPPAQATPKQTIKTMGILFKCGVTKQPLVMALTGILEPPLWRTASASERGHCCLACPSPRHRGLFLLVVEVEFLRCRREKDFHGWMGFHVKLY